MLCRFYGAPFGSDPPSTLENSWVVGRYAWCWGVPTVLVSVPFLLWSEGGYG